MKKRRRGMLEIKEERLDHVLRASTKEKPKNAMKRIQITDRDIELLKFINEHGFCGMPHLNKRFDLKKPNNYEVIRRLVDTGLVRHEKIFHGKHGFYRLTSKGAKHTDLPALACIPLGQYKHELVLLDVSLKLQKLYPQAQYWTERRLKREKYFNEPGKKSHLADGLLMLPDSKPIAIEIELTMKSQRRLDGILKSYAKQFSKIKEVWYFCSSQVLPPLQKLTANKPFIKAFSLEEFLK